MKKTLTTTLCLFFLISCSKNTCVEALQYTYSDYNGYRQYCNFQTNEIKSEMILMDTKKVTICENELFYIGIDTIIPMRTNCPRVGAIFVTKRIVIK